MTTPDAKLSTTIHAWQERLLQLDRRNSLIYFKGGSTTVPVLTESMDHLDSRLQQSRNGLTFPFAERIGRSTSRFGAPDDPPTTQEVRTRAGDLSSSLDPLELQRRLRTMSKRAREWEEEQGLNVLFLACGFLNWIDQDGEPARAPLLLLPCQLRQSSARDPFTLSRESDEVLTNATLQFVLHRMGIELPEFDQETIAEYLTAVTRRFRSRQWTVSEDVYLATFSYAKLAMWDDLEQMRTSGTEHEVIGQLAGTGATTDTDSFELSALPTDLAGGALDDFEPPEDDFAILPADFSQRLAIRAARAGQNLVIHGPPGTGKSQTIANIIASLLADGKKVLFVSEKTAALDVVKRRLAASGLESFCLDLHSERAQKSAVYEQLRQSLRSDSNVGAPDFDYAGLRRRRASLNLYSRAIHTPRSLGTIYQIHGRYAEVATAPQIEWESVRTGAVTADLLERVEATTARIARRPREFREHDTSVWRVLRAETPSVLIADQIRTVLRSLRTVIDASRAQLQPVASWLGLPAPYDIEGAEHLEEVALHMAEAPQDVLQSWLSGEHLSLLVEVVDLEQRQQTERTKLRTELDDWFGAEPFSADWQQIRTRIDVSAEERGLLSECVGPNWEQEVLTTPEGIARKIGDLRLRANEAIEATRLTTQFFDAPAVTLSGLRQHSEILEQVTEIGLVPIAWLRGGGLTEPHDVLTRARDQQSALQSAEETLFADFDPGIIDAVEEALIARFRADYGSALRRIFGGYRRDLRTLRSNLRGTLKLDYGTARDVVERAADIRARRKAWLDGEAAKAEILGAGFRGRETDWARIEDEIERVTNLAEIWPMSRATLEPILTVDAARPEVARTLAGLQAAISNLVGALERLDQTRLDHSTDIAKIAERTLALFAVLDRLTPSLDPILARATRPVRLLSEVRKLCDTATRLQAIESDDTSRSPRLAALRDEDWVRLIPGRSTASEPGCLQAWQMPASRRSTCARSRFYFADSGALRYPME